ncbi:hypothetical protein LJ739_16870 [Aestuariibacter halophilus]|uniref:Uncharacterized protein n=1 Tax=Fluctibacter halophilus TaxID=226011 RepID=A0ABS8GC05_9ALTE|nr:hypothetical protein [Aestuariibacter halophilus]MCC2617928.1 hypothetical protein [Aestuariibacter halophilus]
MKNVNSAAPTRKVYPQQISALLIGLLASTFVFAKEPVESARYVKETGEYVIQTADGVFQQGTQKISPHGSNTTLRSINQSMGATDDGDYSIERANLNIAVTESLGSNGLKGKNSRKASPQAYSYNLSGDFNGDGCTDTATVNGDRISITMPCASRTRYYNFSGNVAINGVYDTDGEAGVEIVVVNAPYLEIVDAADDRKRSYYLGSNWAINGHYDANGRSGNEIGIVKSHHLVFIEDIDQDTTDFYLSWNSWSINGNYDTDGDPGVELGVVSSGYFTLFDLRDYRWRNYGISGAYFVNGAQNIDNKAGKEVLINNYGRSQNATIYDATGVIRWERY